MNPSENIVDICGRWKSDRSLVVVHPGKLDSVVPPKRRSHKANESEKTPKRMNEETENSPRTTHHRWAVFRGIVITHDSIEVIQVIEKVKDYVGPAHWVRQDIVGRAM